MKYAQAFVIFPGGFGTMDEFFESLTLIQTMKMEHFPVILVGTKFWKSLLDWIEQIMLHEHGNISSEDINISTLTDDPNEVVRIICESSDRCWLEPGGLVTRKRHLEKPGM